jgi:hypothetical protein
MVDAQTVSSCARKVGLTGRRAEAWVSQERTTAHKARTTAQWSRPTSETFAVGPFPTLPLRCEDGDATRSQTHAFRRRCPGAVALFRATPEAASGVRRCHVDRSDSSVGARPWSIAPRGPPCPVVGPLGRPDDACRSVGAVAQHRHAVRGPGRGRRYLFGDVASNEVVQCLSLRTVSAGPWSGSAVRSWSVCPGPGSRFVQRPIIFLNART